MMPFYSAVMFLMVMLDGEVVRQCDHRFSMPKLERAAVAMVRPKVGRPIDAILTESLRVNVRIAAQGMCLRKATRP